MSSDMIEIQQVVLKYAIAVDCKAPDLLDEIFTPDATITIKLFDVRTRDQMRDKLRAAIAGGGGLDAIQHFCGPAIVKVDGDRAWSRCYFIATHVRNEMMPDGFLTIGGMYDDELVKVDGRWLISARTGTSQWWSGNPAVVGAQRPVGGIEWMDTRGCPPWLAPTTLGAPEVPAG